MSNFTYPHATMKLDLEWDPPLRHRRGAEKRLHGIDVFYDFDWLEVFPDERTQFENGQCLAKRVLDECPDDKTPALLLTVRADADEGARIVGLFYVVVVNIPQYLAVASADAAMAYLASRQGPDLTRVVRLPDLAHISFDELDEILDRRLDAHVLSRWAADNKERSALLRTVGRGPGSDTDPRPRIDAAVEALQALDQLHDEVAAAIADHIGPGMDTGTRFGIVHAMTADLDGRRVTAEVLSERARDRLADAWEAVREFEGLISDPDACETILQQFLEHNPWLFGLHYAQVRARFRVIRGVVDLILDRFDGLHDLLEIKGRRDAIFEAAASDRSERPLASQYRLSEPLAQALAQVHVYRDDLRHDAVLEEDFGLWHSREPRAIIVIGSAATLSDHGRRILRELNRLLHRVEIVPYDVLGQRASAILENVERYLVAVEDEIDLDS